jgi:hypothetical protein
MAIDPRSGIGHARAMDTVSGPARTGQVAPTADDALAAVLRRVEPGLPALSLEGVRVADR